MEREASSWPYLERYDLPSGLTLQVRQDSAVRDRRIKPEEVVVPYWYDLFRGDFMQRHVNREEAIKLIAGEELPELPPAFSLSKRNDARYDL